MLRRDMLVFDCESVGLYGEVFAFGAVLVSPAGERLREWQAACHPGCAPGPDDGRRWVAANVRVPAYDCLDTVRVRLAFAAVLREAAARGATVWSDRGVLVEAWFLRAVRMDSDARDRTVREPLHEVATACLLADVVPETLPPLPDELPPHDPLCDARRSARLLLAALRRLAAGGVGPAGVG